MRYSWTRVLFAVGVVVGTIAVVWFVLGPLPEWVAGREAGQLPPNERIALVGSIRGQCIQLASVAGGLITVGYGVRRYFLDREKQRLEQDKHVTDRFSSAVGHLGSTEETVRAGGIRTLDRIMSDSARDHQWVVDTLCDTLRHKATPTSGTRLPDEVTAAASALRTRPRRTESHPPDLAGVHLPGVNLRGAWLTDADLSEADLTGADLAGAVLDGANLRGARLDGAKLIGAHLTGTVLYEANLEQAELTDADLSRADLRRARLRDATVTRTRMADADIAGADFRGVDLTQVSGLTDEAIRSAVRA